MVRYRLAGALLVGLIVAAVLGGIAVTARAVPLLSAQEPGELSLVAQQFGSSRAVAVAGAYVLIGEGPRVSVLANDDKLSFVGQSTTLGGLVQDIEVIGQLAYVALGSAGIAMLDLRQLPGVPVVASYEGGNSAQRLTRDPRGIWLSDGSNGQLLDLTVPLAPDHLLYYPDSLSGGSRSVAFARDIATDGQSAFMVGGGRVTAVDLADPAQPVARSGELAGVSDYQRVVAGDGLLYLAPASGQRLTILDQRLETADGRVEERGGLALRSPVEEMALVDRRLLLTLTDGPLLAVDVSNPARPETSAALELPGAVGPLAATADRVFAVEPGLGVHRVDVAVNGGSLTRQAFYPVVGRSSALAIDGRRGYVLERPNSNDSAGDRGSLAVLDLNEPGAARLTGRLQIAGVPTTLALAGNLVYVAYAGDRNGLEIVEVDPGGVPRTLSRFEEFADLSSLHPVGPYLLASYGYGQGLCLLDLTDPARPRVAARRPAANEVADIAVAGRYAYIADRANRLGIVDLGRLGQLDMVQEIDTAAQIERLVAVGSHLHAIQADGDLARYDLSDPLSPRLVARHPLRLRRQLMGPLEMALSDSLLAVVTNEGLRAIDLSDPVAPRELALPLYMDGWMSAAIEGNVLYGLNFDQGLWMFRLGPSAPAVPPLPSATPDPAVSRRWRCFFPIAGADNE